MHPVIAAATPPPEVHKFEGNKLPPTTWHGRLWMLVRQTGDLLMRIAQTVRSYLPSFNFKALPAPAKRLGVKPKKKNAIETDKSQNIKVPQAKKPVFTIKQPIKVAVEKEKEVVPPAKKAIEVIVEKVDEAAPPAHSLTEKAEKTTATLSKPVPALKAPSHTVKELSALGKIPTPEKNTLPLLRVFNVPDNGNCLFYAAAIALWKEGASVLDSGTKEAWDNQLTGLEKELKSGYNECEKLKISDYLDPIADALRQETSRSLEQILKKAGYFDNTQPTEVDLFAEELAMDIEHDGIASHNEKVQRCIDNEGRLVNTLINEQETMEIILDALKNSPLEISILQLLIDNALIIKREITQRSCYYKEWKAIDQKIQAEKPLNTKEITSLQDMVKSILRIHAKEVEKAKDKQNEAILRLKADLIDMENRPEAFKKYLKFSKNHGFFGGFCHLKLLCQQFNVIIIVWTPGEGSEFIQGKNIQSREIDGVTRKPTVFGNQAAGNQDKRPILQILHEDGNHFKYIAEEPTKVVKQ